VNLRGTDWFVEAEQGIGIVADEAVERVTQRCQFDRSSMPPRRRGPAHRMRKKLNRLVEPFRAFQRCFRRSRSEHQLAASVAQFDLSERVAHVVEGEDSGNRHFQLAPCNEVSQFGDHCCGCGIRAAF